MRVTAAALLIATDIDDDPFAAAGDGYHPGSYEWMVAEGLL
jgi:hypothetical protein